MDLWSGLCSESFSEYYTAGDDCQVVCPQCGRLAPVTETPQIQRLRKSIGSHVRSTAPVVVPGSEGTEDNSSLQEERRR